MIFSLCVTHFDHVYLLTTPLSSVLFPVIPLLVLPPPFFSRLAHFYYFCGFVFGPMYFTRGIPRSMDEIWFHKRGRLICRFSSMLPCEGAS